MRPSLIASVLFFAIGGSAMAEEFHSNTSVVLSAPGSFAQSPPRQLVHKTQLDYPKSVTPQDREISISLRYTIERDGHVDDIEVVKGARAAFVREAKKAVGGWIYAPAAEPTPGATALVLFHAAP